MGISNLYVFDINVLNTTDLIADSNVPAPRNNFFISTVILSIITAILIVSNIITCAILIYVYKNKHNTEINNAIYESPDDAKPELFNMTECSVYEMHKTA